MKTLAIETSCDDTSVGVINFDWKKFNVEHLYSYSQIKEHSQYGGIVPEVASRLHQEKILAVLQQIGLEEIKKVDFITVTAYPWLPGSLIVWKTVANTLWEFLNKKVVEVDHIMGHIFSIFLERSINEIKFPMVVLTASGGHNEMYVIYRKSEKSLKKFWRKSEETITDNLGMESQMMEKKITEDLEGSQKIGEFEVMKIWYTLDDAAGEAFDKVARMLGGPYPGGPWISELAGKITEYEERITEDKKRLQKMSENHKQSREWITDNFSKKLQAIRDGSKSFLSVLDLVNKRIRPIFLSVDKYEFSFSGYKSQVWYLLQELEKKGIELTDDLKSYIAWRFQESVVEVLAKKIVQAAMQFNAQTIAIVWWVSANDRLWQYTSQLVEKKKQKGILLESVQILRPAKKIYSTDNAAMIGVVGIIQELEKINF